MKLWFRAPLLPFLVGVFGACGGGGTGGGGSGGGGGGGGDPCDFSALTTYESPSFAANAAAALDLHEHWEDLEGLMVGAEATPPVPTTAAALTAALEAGSPSLRDAMVDGLEPSVLALFDDFEAAIGQTWTPAEPPAGPGGAYGSEGALFTAEGLMLREGVEKATYLGALWAHGLSVLDGALDEASLDQVLAAYGATPAFRGDSESGLADGDDLMAKYAERRSAKDPNDASLPLDPAAPGPYFRIKAHFLTAKGALAAGSCQAALDGAVAGLKQELELVAAATAIYYLNRASLLATDANATTDTLAEALGAWSEAVGFLTGLRSLPASARVVDDATLDGLLAAVGGTGSPLSGYLLVTDPGSLAPDLAQAIADLSTAYGFEPAEVESFKQAY